MKKLQKLRQKIDQIDRRIVQSIDERTQIALEIGRQKLLNRQGIYAPDREVNVYENILKESKGLLSVDSFKAIFREIMSAALCAEKGLQVAFLGPLATFTHQASIRKFGSSVKYVPCDSISDVFIEVEKGRADYGVVPIENTTEGAVSHTLDMFSDSELKICSEVSLRIRHSLLSNYNLHTIRTVYSNPQVFGQCRHWLEFHLPKANLVEVSSTSRAAEIASKENLSAAISSELAVNFYSVKVIARDIEDFKTNTTRFLVIGSHVAKKTGRDKTSIMFSIKDRVGALYEILVPFKKFKINMTKIESRPSKKKAWEYYFYVDFLGHQDDENVRKALSALDKHCHFLKVLGSYPFVARD